MKLVLMALAVETLLARVFAGSWELAVTLVVAYCAIVYAVMSRKVYLAQKRNKNKTQSNSRFDFIQSINSNRSSENPYYTV
jgi:beta-lactamase regulating signal transducer with metallopeptidase domain